MNELIKAAIAMIIAHPDFKEAVVNIITGELEGITIEADNINDLHHTVCEIIKNANVSIDIDP